MSSNYLFLWAPTMRVAEVFADRAKLPEGSWIYLHQVRQIRGVWEPRVVYLWELDGRGKGPHQRRVRAEILRELRSRNAVFIETDELEGLER